jgi:hypothetical protein
MTLQERVAQLIRLHLEGESLEHNEGTEGDFAGQELLCVEMTNGNDDGCARFVVGDINGPTRQEVLVVVTSFTKE